MGTCVVPFCKSNTVKNKNLSFHEIPSDERKRMLWLINIARRGETEGSLWVPSQYSRVCSLHFLKSDFMPNLKYRRLRPDAVPTVFPMYPQNMQPKSKHELQLNSSSKQYIKEISPEDTCISDDNIDDKFNLITKCLKPDRVLSVSPEHRQPQPSSKQKPSLVSVSKNFKKELSFKRTSHFDDCDSDESIQYRSNVKKRSLKPEADSTGYSKLIEELTSCSASKHHKKETNYNVSGSFDNNDSDDSRIIDYTPKSRNRCKKPDAIPKVFSVFPKRRKSKLKQKLPLHSVSRQNEKKMSLEETSYVDDSSNDDSTEYFLNLKIRCSKSDGVPTVFLVYPKPRLDKH